MASNDEERSATTIFTTAAQSIAARLIANKTTAKFTKAEISTTNLFNQSVTELQVLTSLDNVQQTADINTVTVINDNTVDVNIAIDQTKAPNDYQMNSVGLYAKDGDGKEVLYSVTVLKDPVYIHQDAMGSALGIDLETVVGQSKNVDLSINPAGAVTNEALKVTLADYVKTDDVEKLIPATVIDGSKPADFKESVTLEKGAVDGAGNAIATTKNVSDGDAETFKSAKAYTDTQASDKVKTSDIDPSVMAKTTPITNTTDLFTLDPGTYFGNNVTPVNGPAINSLPTTNYFWVRLETPKANPSIKKLIWTDNGNHQYVNEYYGVSAKWHDWQILNEDSVVKDNGDDTVSINGKSYVPANAANVVDRNPNTGVVSEPVDFTKLTVNGGKSVATSDDLKSIEASAWRPIISDNYSGLCMMKYNADIGTMSLSGTIFPKMWSPEGSRSAIIIPLPSGFAMGKNSNAKISLMMRFMNNNVQQFEYALVDLLFETDGIHIVFDKVYAHTQTFIVLDGFFNSDTKETQSSSFIDFKVTKN